MSAITWAQTTVFKCRHTYNQYIKHHQSRTKRLGAIIKVKRCGQTGIVPLKEGNIMHFDPKTKVISYIVSSCPSLLRMSHQPFQTWEPVHIHLWTTLQVWLNSGHEHQITPDHRSGWYTCQVT